MFIMTRSFSLKSGGVSPTLSESELMLLGFDLISISMISTGTRPNIDWNGVNSVESNFTGLIGEQNGLDVHIPVILVVVEELH